MEAKLFQHCASGRIIYKNSAAADPLIGALFP
jgi:hypothetical protein